MICLRIFDVFLTDFYVIDAQAITRRHCKAQQDTVAVRLYGAAMSDCIPNVAVATLLRPLAMFQLTDAHLGTGVEQNAPDVNTSVQQLAVQQDLLYGLRNQALTTVFLIDFWLPS